MREVDLFCAKCGYKRTSQEPDRRGGETGGGKGSQAGDPQLSRLRF